MLKLKIDNKIISVKEGTSLIEAARENGIEIPSLCYIKGVPHYSSCMVCMVKDNSTGKYIPSCSARAEEGMDIDASGEKVIRLRKEAIELLLVEHRAECEAPCSRVCPMGLDIPAMNRLVAAGNLKKAARLIHNELIIPELACSICPGYCENACRRKMIDESISIRAIIKYTSLLAEPGEVPSGDRATKLLPGFDQDKALSGQGVIDKKAIREMAKAKQEARIAGESGTESAKEIYLKRFNSTLGKINDDEKKEWLKECLKDGARWTSIESEANLLEEAAACMHCDCRAKDDCRLRDLADELNVANPKLKLVSHPVEKKINSKNKLIYENAKCIKCGLCVRMSTDEPDNPALCFTGRGYMTLISEPLTCKFSDVYSKGIDEIVKICPTGALEKMENDDNK